MRSRRPRTALAFVGLGVLLLLSVAVGQRIGERALFGSTERRVPAAAPLATPVPGASAEDRMVSKNWKRQQVVSVPTDPAFPDPRVTRPPTPSPKPSPVPTPVPVRPYTSPPLPIPIVSHEPDETLRP
jgi:hypothetical protein